MAAILRMSKRKIQTKGILVMKKRLLSLLLVACMLLSMVPMFSAVAIAEEMPVAEGATEPYDYSKLYVTAGLVGLYTSFKGENYFDLSQMNGTWQNRVAGGAPAVLGQSKVWTTEKHGGLGFVLTQYQTSATEGSHAYLGLPEEYTAMDNFTIEFFANMRYVTNADGTRGGTYSGTSTYAFRLGFLSLSGPLNGNRLDWRPLYTRYTLDNLNWGNMQYDPLGGDLDVYSGNSTLRDWYTAKNTSGKIYSDLHSELIVGTDARIGATGPVAFTKVTAENGNATFGYYNLSATGTIGTWTKDAMDKAESTTITYEKGDKEITENKKNLGTTLSTALFFNSLPTFLYAVRVYDDALTDTEKMQNFFADVCAYCNLDMTAFDALSTEEKNAVIAEAGASFKELRFDNGSEKAYNGYKELAQSYLDMAITGNALNDYDKLYVGADGSATANGGKLTALWTAFDAGYGYAVAKTGVWYDKMNGLAATLKGNIWGTTESGVGYNMTAGVNYGDTALGFGMVSASDPYYTVDDAANCKIDMPKSLLLNVKDYTLDIISKTQTKVYHTDAKGNLTDDLYIPSTTVIKIYKDDGTGTFSTLVTSTDSKGAIVDTFSVSPTYAPSGPISFGSDKRTVTLWLGTTSASASASGNRVVCSFTEGADGKLVMDEYVLGSSSLTFNNALMKSLAIDTVLYKADGTVFGKGTLVQLEFVSENRTSLWGYNTMMAKIGLFGVFGFYDKYVSATADTLGYQHRFFIQYGAGLHWDSGGRWSVSNFWETGTNTISRDAIGFATYERTVTGEGEAQKQTYTIYKDGASHKTATINSYKQVVDSTTKDYPLETDTTKYDFYLFNKTPASVYVMRMYDAVLTEEEKAQNHFVDICAYYGLDVSLLSKVTEKEKKGIYACFSSVTFEDGNKEDLQKQLYTAVEKCAVNEYDMLYVGMDGSETANGGKLTMFLSALAGTSSADLVNGKWYDKTGNYDATLTSTSGVKWISRGENGVGYDMLGGTIKADGTFDTSANYTILQDARLTLNVEALKALNDGHYTLDYVADFRSVQWYDLNGVLQTTNHANANMAGYTTYSEWIGTLKNIYQRSDTKSDLYARQTRWFLAPGNTLWGGGQYYFNSQLHGETSRQGGGIQAHEIIRVKKTETLPTWIFTYEDGSTVEIGQNKLNVFGGAYTFLTDGTKYVVTAGSKKISDTLSHPVYNIALEDGTVVSTNLYSGYADLFGTLKEGTVTVTEGETETDKYTLTMTKDGSKYKEGIYYTNVKVMTTTTATQLSRADYAHNGLDGYVSDSTSTNFIMFNRTPCAVYSVRLYDADLTAEEKAQNHFADLCAYYLVDIAGFADATADAKAAAYAAVANLKLLAEGDAEYVATKAKVQAAIDNAKATEFGAGKTLPTVIEGVEDRVVAVWVTLDGETKYLPGTVLEKSETLVPVLVHKGETVNGAGVNLAFGGIRFKTTFSASDFYTLGKEMGTQYASFSMIIAPELYVEKLANGVFTKKALGDGNYVEVAIDGYYDLVGDTYVLAGGLSELSAVTKENDLAFAAVLCLTVTVGDESYEIYGDYNAETNRSGLDVLTPYAKKVVAGELTVESDLADDLYALYTGFAKYDPVLAADLKTALGLK